jgi:hypothetical protein
MKASDGKGQGAFLRLLESIGSCLGSSLGKEARTCAGHDLRMRTFVQKFYIMSIRPSQNNNSSRLEKATYSPVFRLAKPAMVPARAAQMAAVISHI